MLDFQSSSVGSHRESQKFAFNRQIIILLGITFPNPDKTEPIFLKTRLQCWVQSNFYVDCAERLLIPILYFLPMLYITTYGEGLVNCCNLQAVRFNKFQYTCNFKTHCT